MGERELPSPLPTPVHVSANGGAVAVYRDPQTIVITGFSPSGRRQILARGTPAQIAPDSVALQGNTVHWLSDGQPASATLPAS